MITVIVDGEHLTIEDVIQVAHAAPGDIHLELAPEARQKVDRARAAVEDFVARGQVIYGITTGFGAFKPSAWANRCLPPSCGR